jgi:hypothetical protein
LINTAVSRIHLPRFPLAPQTSVNPVRLVDYAPSSSDEEGSSSAAIRTFASFYSGQACLWSCGQNFTSSQTAQNVHGTCAKTSAENSNVGVLQPSVINDQILQDRNSESAVIVVHNKLFGGKGTNRKLSCYFCDRFVSRCRVI